jgi:hypothetical protein
LSADLHFTKPDTNIVTSRVRAYILLQTSPTCPPVMRYLRPEYVNKDTWARLPEEAQRRLDATPPNQRNAQESEESAYRVYGESAPPDHDIRAAYAL